MENTGFGGLDNELGTGAPQAVITVAEPEKPKRRMFYEWIVGGNSYRLKLNTSMICKLEEKFGRNLLDVVTANGVPPLAQMLTIVQGAMAPWNHQTSYRDVQALFDKYVSEGGNQMDFYGEVIMQIMAVSGFFTDAQAQELTKKMQEATQML